MKKVGFTITVLEETRFRGEFVHEAEAVYELTSFGTWVYSERTRMAYHDWSEWSEWTKVPDVSYVPSIGTSEFVENDWIKRREVSWTIEES